MKVRIFKPAKTAKQSGRGKTTDWLLESEPAPKEIDPLMGWTGSRNTMEQVQMWFLTLDEAKAHAEKNGWQFTVELPKGRDIKPKAYADNFHWSRTENWTH